MSKAQDKKPKDKDQSSEESSSEENEPENLAYKIIVLGNPTVGKTQVICRYCEDFFSANYKKTIGVDFFQKRLEMSEDVNVSL